MWQQILGIVVGLALAGLMVRQVFSAAAARKNAPAHFFGDARSLLESASISSGEAAGTYAMSGRFDGHEIQVKAVTDTLAVRKLPGLWLMVTIPGPLPLKATFDMMMRPSGPTTFSNFDHLPVTISRPPDFPEQAVVRTDDPEHLLPPYVVAPHLGPFFGPAAKELLVTPKGLRMVVLLAEADRARYGVFRQADFGDMRLERGQLTDIITRLVAIRRDILAWQSSNA